jgi:hypothetical protein
MSELDEAMIRVRPSFLVMSKWMRHFFARWAWHPINHPEVEWKRWPDRTVRNCFYRGVEIICTDYTRDGEQVLDYNEPFGDCPATTSLYVIGDHKRKMGPHMQRFALNRKLLDSIEDKIVIRGIRKGEFRD